MSATKEASASSKGKGRATAPLAFSPPPPPPPSPSPSLVPTARHFVILSGEVEDVQPYCNGTVDWMLHILPAMFGSHTPGRLMRHRTGTTTYWEGRAWEPERWEQVRMGDQVEAKIYEFVPDGGARVDVALHCLPRSHSSQPSATTTTTGTWNATSFQKALEERDGGCVVTGSIPYFCVASHLAPKRLGDGGIQQLVASWTPSPDITSKYDPRLAVMMALPLDKGVDDFSLGFYRTDDSYILHSFSRHPDYQGFDVVSPGGVSIHGRPIRVPSGPLVPSPFLYDWHYLQCILTRFGTDETEEPGHTHLVVDRKRDSSGSSDEEGDPEIPSARFDRVWASIADTARLQQQAQRIDHWRQGISVE
ncbi:Ras-related GTP-binding protein D [Pseudohyphozyma bogoriensis]|nr:Ras-related GTP-binding protein D [Pseudohyphozyma bogoriensis]